MRSFLCCFTFCWLVAHWFLSVGGQLLTEYPQLKHVQTSAKENVNVCTAFEELVEVRAVIGSLDKIDLSNQNFRLRSHTGNDRAREHGRPVTLQAYEGVIPPRLPEEEVVQAVLLNLLRSTSVYFVFVCGRDKFCSCRAAKHSYRATVVSRRYMLPVYRYPRFPPLRTHAFRPAPLAYCIEKNSQLPKIRVSTVHWRKKESMQIAAKDDRYYRTLSNILPRYVRYVRCMSFAFAAACDTLTKLVKLQAVRLLQLRRGKGARGSDRRHRQRCQMGAGLPCVSGTGTHCRLCARADRPGHGYGRQLRLRGVGAGAVARPPRAGPVLLPWSEVAAHQRAA